MKKSVTAALLVLLLVSLGCQQQQNHLEPGILQAREKVSDAMHNLSQALPVVKQTAAPSREAIAELSTLQHEIGVLVSDGNLIGPDHYSRLKARLNALDGKSLDEGELQELREKLLLINPEKNDIVRQFNAVESELDNIIAEGIVVGQEKHDNFSAKLGQFLADGLSEDKVAGLRKKLSAITAEKPTLGNETPPEYEEFNRAALPDCSGQLFNFTPVNLGRVYDIGGLGGIGPPGHTFPTEHTYWHVSATGTTTEVVDLYAPGDVVITEVVSTPELEITDYTIRFALCKDIHGYYNHAKAISEELSSVLDGIECEEFDSPTQGCTKKLHYPVKAGTVVGKVGHIQGNFDVGALDYRVTNKFANPSRYHSRSPNIVCPFEYFTPEIKSQIYAKVKRKAEPRCGSVMQDIMGTLQGNWFFGNGTAELEWEKQLAFVHEASDQGKATISVGGTLSGPEKWTFSPQHSELANRGFSEVVPNGSIYCYDQGQPPGKPGRIILQLLDQDTLKIERQVGNCNEPISFSVPKIYNR